jgi:hypothetical protein
MTFTWATAVAQHTTIWWRYRRIMAFVWLIHMIPGITPRTVLRLATALLTAEDRQRVMKAVREFLIYQLLHST